MKQVLTFLAAVLLTASVFAQAPEKMSYQAVIRNNNGDLVVNQSVKMRISIQKFIFGMPPSYQDKYIETHTATTNENGLVSLKIGEGTVVSGVFSNIDWSDGEYYIKTETDPTGGTNYTITGRSQLLSVPYALYAKTSGRHYVGERYGGGIVFWVDETGQHGLIAAIADQSSGIQWYNGKDRYTGTGDGLYAGIMNTTMIVATHMADNPDGNFAAKVCADYSVTENGVTYGDWYLPSKYELNLLYLQKNVVGGFSGSLYWSSTEVSTGSGSGNAWYQGFTSGVQSAFFKNNTLRVRAIRAF